MADGARLLLPGPHKLRLGGRVAGENPVSGVGDAAPTPPPVPETQPGSAHPTSHVFPHQEENGRIDVPGQNLRNK